MKSSENQVDVTFIIPCLNEVESLPYCIERAQMALNELADRYKLSGEILVSDNGSTDGSQALSVSMGARLVSCAEKGYGNALRAGFKESYGRYLVMADADGSYDFLESVQMIEQLNKGHDVCMGSRFKGKIESGAMPWKNRYIGNPVLTGILNMFFNTNVSDAHCGIRAFTRDAIKIISPTSTGMEFASELVIKAKMLGLSQTEVPVTLSPDKRGRHPHLRPWRDGWRHLRYLIMLSPTWLFFVPAFFLAVLGFGLFSILLLGSNQSGGVVDFAGFRLGDHWAILAGGFVSIGYLSIIFGIATVLQGIMLGYKRIQDFPMILFKACQLEVMLVVGSLLLVAGAAELGYVIFVWEKNDFGGLSMIREMVFANTLFVIGMQTFYLGFLLSTLAGNSDIAEVINAVRKRNT